jgi:membrane associated rhomboid family serine protease
MGLYDRDYERERNYYDDRPGFHLGGQLSLTTKLVFVMFAIYLVQVLASGGWVTNALSLHADVLRRPWHLYQLLSYGFLHDPGDFRHIVFNMVTLWFFGRPLEERYGGREFLSFFLTAIVFAGLVWLVTELAAYQGFAPNHIMMGASGGIAAVLILFAMNYPNQTVLFMFFIPMKMWVLAVILVIVDALGFVHGSQGVAFSAHLGGAAFGYLYYRWGRRLENWLPAGNVFKRLKPGPKLRVHDPAQTDADELRMDEILKKIQEHGQDSLTRAERRFMEKQSREFQKRRR